MSETVGVRVRVRMTEEGREREKLYALKMEEGATNQGLQGGF